MSTTCSNDSSSSLPCTPRPVRVFHRNFLTSSFDSFSFNENFTENCLRKSKLQEDSHFLDDCSKEQMKEDFKTLKAKSEILMVRDEICQILSNQDICYPINSRPKNPFWKNLEE